MHIAKVNIHNFKCFKGLFSLGLKIRNIGLFSERIDERNYDYKEDSEQHIDEPGSMREIKWVLSPPSNLRELAALIERAIPD